MRLRFGAILYGDPLSTASQARALEQAGMADVWFGEVPSLGFGDPFAAIREAAAATARVGVGTAVTPAGLRNPVTLVAQLASLNAHAPGRVTLGYGTGTFSRRVVGLPPIGLAGFEEELRALRALLDGEVAVLGGQRVGFREPRGGLELADPVRLLVAAGGPRTAALAGRYGDGLLAAAGELDPGRLGALRDAAVAAALAAGRDFAGSRFVVEVGPLCLLREGEDLASPRVLAMVQPAVTGMLLFWAALGTEPEEVPAGARDGYAAFLAAARAEHGPDPRDILFGLGPGAFWRRPALDRFLSPELLAACTLTGPPAELRDRLAAIAAAGVTDVALIRGGDYVWQPGPDLAELELLIGALA